MAETYVVLTTCGAEAAETLARRPVEERLAACCNRLPGVRSTYWWEGRLEEGVEVLLVYKTPADRLDALLARLAALHPYAVPEVLAFPAAAGHPPYMAWVAAETRPTA